MRQALTFLLLLPFVSQLRGQQTVEEMVMAELLSWREAPLYYKAPMDATLELGAPIPVIVDADALPDAAPPAPLPVHLTQTRAIAPTPGTGLPICPTGICVSFSSQGAAALKANTGKLIKGFQMVDATIYANHDADVSVGLVIMLARSMGIQTVDNQTGLAIVAKTLSLDWRAVVKLVVVAGLEAGTAITVGGVFKGVPIGLTKGLTFGHLAMDQILPPLFAIGAPKGDPYVNAAKNPDDTLSLKAGKSTHFIVGAIFGSTKDSVVTGPILLMP